ncbi:zinc finger protein 585A [Drosophila madeirensis]|uniref:Zinc finger protein 585A n=1 Tax=Drosophila madeirensis TaxID=30013 RepID=A0AAU9F0Q9_DROMD
MPRLFLSKEERLQKRSEALAYDTTEMEAMLKPDEDNNTAAAAKPIESDANKENKGQLTFHYGNRSPSDDWLKSDDIPIVVRRQWEERNGRQLMDLQPEDANESEEFSHTVWELEKPGQSQEPGKKKNGAKIGYIKVTKDGKRVFLKDKQGPKQVPQQPSANADQPQTKTITRRSKQKGEQFPCTDCDKVFNHSWMLVAHQRTHTGERPYVCPEPKCLKSFADRSNLRSHQRTKGHHTWDHQCGQCGKYFNQENFLKRHTLDACRKYLLNITHKKT